MIKSKFFPDSKAQLVTASGFVLNEDEKTGVQVNLFWKDGAETPHGAELFSVNVEELYAEIGLWFEGKKLVDYDGVFSLPSEVAELLKENGFDLSEVEE